MYLILLPFIYAIIVSIIFGSINTIVYIITEYELDDYLDKKGINKKVIPLLEGGISSSLAILITAFIEKYLLGINMIKHPMIDVLGILLGTIIIIIIYIHVNRLNRSNKLITS